MTRHRRLKGAAALCIAALSLSLTVLAIPTIATAAKTSGPHRGGTLTIVGNFNFPTLDPSSAKASTGSGQTFFFAIYDSLLKLGSNGQGLQPELVQSWTVSKNGQTVTLNLRKGVKFQDGTPFNAAAVAWNINHDAAAATGCVCYTFLTAISSVTTPSQYKVVIHLSHAYEPLLTAFANSGAAYMVSPTAYQAEPAAQFGQYPVGAGPFKVTQNSPQVSLTVTKNPNYWNKGKPYLSAITWNVVAVTTSAYETLSSGAAQFMTAADPTSLTQARSQSNLKILAFPATTWYAWQFNVLAPPFNNILAREAVAYATDFKPINTAVYGGLETPSQSLWGPGTQQYYGNTMPDYLTYNPTKAAALVSQLGGLSFSTFTVNNSTINEELLQALQKEMDAVGIHMTILNLQQAQAIANNESGDYTAIVTNNGNYDPSLIADNFFLYSGSFDKGLNDSHLNALVAQADATTSESARHQLFKEMSIYINQQVFFVPLYTGPSYDLASSNLEGIVKSSLVYLDTAYLKA